MENLALHFVGADQTLIAPRSGTEAPATDGGVLLSRGRVIHRHRRIWTHSSAVVQDVICEDGVAIEVRSNSTIILMVMEEVGGRIEIRSRSPYGAVTVPAPIGPIAVVPSGFTAQLKSDSSKFLRLFSLEFGMATSNEDNTTKKPMLGLSEPRLSKICRLLALECKGPEFHGSDYADNLVSALSIALSRYEQTVDRQAPKGGLAPWQLRRVQDFMMENITKTVPVRDLADLAQISLTHFNRAFKASVGCAPHQWMTERRIEIAKKHLLTGTIAIVEISLALGFCDQAHFTRVFRRSVGDTPLVWQRARRR